MFRSKDHEENKKYNSEIRELTLEKFVSKANNKYHESEISKEGSTYEHYKQIEIEYNNKNWI